MLQSNQVLSFFRSCERGDWSQRELAEFYRVEDALTKSGVVISTDRGLTDEGEPWFVFFRQDDEEVIVHFARIGGEYVVASNFTEAVFRGRNFQTLVRELLDSHPYVLPKQHSSRSTVFLHPATLLAALVVTGYVKSSELTATALDLQDAVHHANEPAIAGLVVNPSGLHPESSHQDNAAASSAHDVFRAENDLVS